MPQARRRNRYHLYERLAVIDKWQEICKSEPNLINRMIKTQRLMKVQQQVTETQAERFEKIMKETAARAGIEVVQESTVQDKFMAAVSSFAGLSDSPAKAKFKVWQIKKLIEANLIKDDMIVEVSTP